MGGVKSKSIIAVLVLICLFLFFVLTILTGYRSIAKGIYKSLKLSGGGQASVIENGWNEGVFMRNRMIDVYGAISKSLGHRIVYDADKNKTVMLGSDGKLYYKGNVTGTDSESAMKYNAERLKDFSEFCKERGSEFLFVIAPDKYCSSQVQLPLPAKDYTGVARDFAHDLDSMGVLCLNMQDKLLRKGEPYSAGFFATDHHWNIRTAFWAFQEIVGKMWPEAVPNVSIEKFQISIATDDYLGSMGIRTGRYYVGTDTVEAITPLFPTDLTVEFNSKTLKKDIKRSGSFETSIIDDQHPGYNMYITSDNSLIHVTNSLSNCGRRILLIKDSFGVPVAAWLSLLGDELWVVDLRYPQEQSVCDMVNSLGINDVIMIYNPEMLGSDMFRFREVSKGK